MDNKDLGATLPETKHCNKCGADHPLSTEFWYFNGDKPRSTCRPCRQAKARATEAAKTANPKPATPLPEALAAPDPADLAASPQLARHREALIRKLIGYANQPSSKHHEWAFKLLAPHLMPKPKPVAAAATAEPKSRGVTITVERAGPEDYAPPSEEIGGA
jgi:hypothetical protein